jgi:hypothetical protein
MSSDFYLLIGFIAVWFILQYWLLPSLGVPT